MPLTELHPLVPAEIAKVPDKPGIYVLFQIQIPIHTGVAADLQKSLKTAKADFPGATHFSIKTGSKNEGEAAQVLEGLRDELGGVRAKGFIGSTPGSR